LAAFLFSVLSGFLLPLGQGAFAALGLFCALFDFARLEADAFFHHPIMLKRIFLFCGKGVTGWLRRGMIGYRKRGRQRIRRAGKN